MPSNAFEALAANFLDVDRLLEIHLKIGGTTPGRRHQLEVLNKSAIVLITAFWEAFCEDVASEALEQILAHATSAKALPELLKKKLAEELKKAPHELAVWELADDGWKKYLRDRMSLLTEARNRKLNTPKSNQIDTHFEEALGIKGISKSWSFGRTKPDQSRRKLDDFIELRGSIAHRGKHVDTVRKKQVTDYAELVINLAKCTGIAVADHVNSVTEPETDDRQQSFSFT